jgi:hypothetical protein
LQPAIALRDEEAAKTRRAAGIRPALKETSAAEPQRLYAARLRLRNNPAATINPAPAIKEVEGSGLSEN